MTPVVMRHRSALTPTERLVLDFVETHTPRRWAHCIHSAAKIAAAVGCSVRSVGLALKRFVALGLVRLVAGERLSFLRRALGWRPTIRRAIELAWRPFAEPDDAPLFAPRDSAKPSCPEVGVFAPSAGLSPTPPLLETEKNPEETDGGGLEALASELPPPPPDFDRLPDPEPEPEPEPEPAPRPAPSKPARKATPAELARLDRAAAKISKDPVFPQRLRRLARAKGLRRVLAAAEIVVKKAEFDDLRNPFGFVLGVIRTFDEDGVTPEIGEDPEVRTKRAWARIIEEFGE